MEIEPDILKQVEADWPTDMRKDILHRLVATSVTPRIQRCIVFAARGHKWHFDYLCSLAEQDWRDVIMAAEYTRFDDHIYDFARPIPDAEIKHPYKSDDTNNERQGITNG